MMHLLITGCANEGRFRPDNAARETNGVDVDLTILSGTMVFAKLNSMMENPDDYLGQTIKIRGPYDAFLYERTGVFYTYVLIEDNAACCLQRLEFILSGQNTFPDDFPERETMIELEGVFESYDEQNQTYYYIAVDEILVL